ncbi:PREDICTED: uncharacterized protein LOC109332471 [Lupinus angustifolius]|uniref:uncharacterized protein LOC109332471 n=1 Tax=Lupinus angustifolius TaxID=3871 RepID=UPI00092F8BDE|nr:PREDICTED: uncharacterized protein LOC109332471 [Lupinus angustifolius]
MRVLSNLGSYLGILLVQGKVGRALFNPILEKIQRRMATWRSNLLNKATHNLKEGFTLHLRSGDRSMWYDNWSGFSKLCNYVNFVNNSNSPFRVKNLWMEGNWEFDNLYTIFPFELKDCIRNNFSPGSHTEDERWIWDGHATRIYNANSGYKWLNYYEEDGNSISDAWRLVWRLRIPEKVKFMCWLGFHEALPSNELRYNRNLESNPRNNSILGDNTWDIHLVARNTHHDCWKWRHLEQGLTLENDLPLLHWCFPAEGKIKLNVDGSYTRDSNIMGVGGLLRDHVGKWLSGFSANYGEGSSILAKLLVMDQGLGLAWNLSFKQIILESDCLAAMQIISEAVQIRLHRILCIVNNVRTWLARDWIVEVKLVVREANMVADFMAKLGSHFIAEFKTWNMVPSNCQYYLDMDLNPFA